MLDQPDNCKTLLKPLRKYNKAKPGRMPKKLIISQTTKKADGSDNTDTTTVDYYNKQTTPPTLVPTESLHTLLDTEKIKISTFLDVRQEGEEYQNLSFWVLTQTRNKHWVHYSSFPRDCLEKFGEMLVISLKSIVGNLAHFANTKLGMLKPFCEFHHFKFFDKANAPVVVGSLMTRRRSQQRNMLVLGGLRTIFLIANARRARD